MHHLKIKTAEETSRKVAEFVKEYLNAWFGPEGLVFDPIVVIPRFLFDEDEEYLHIYVVYDGDEERLDSSYTITLPRLIRDRADEDLTCPPFPILVFSYVEKSEWDGWNSKWSKNNESARFY